MKAEFWHDRWQKSEIAFHQQEINTRLQKYWIRLNRPKNSRVFVPLCGKSLDML
ncbi:MAG: thiopurine S-methyltransferase, partial [Gammaproteobacteria bacterium]|nr:thiopurine S-methyltransferase [Gammaproteobacteria bacterium]